MKFPCIRPKDTAAPPCLLSDAHAETEKLLI